MAEAGFERMDPRSPVGGCRDDGAPLLTIGLPLLVGLIGILIFHRYTIFSGLDQVQADLGDSRFVASVFEHWNAVIHGKAHWDSPLNFYPAKGVLGYSDASLLQGVLHIIFRAFGFGVFQSLNLVVVSCSALTYVAGYFFLRSGLRFSVIASCFGAYFIAFNYPRFAQLVHVQLRFTPLLPVMAHILVIVVRDGVSMSRSKMFFLLATFMVCAVSLTYTTIYYTIFFIVGIIFLLLLMLVHSKLRSNLLALLGRHFVPIGAAVAVAIVLAIPLAQVYLPVMKASGGRPWAEVNSYLVPPFDMFWLGRENVVWGWIGDLKPRWSDTHWAEGRLGFGFLTHLLWLGAIVWAMWMALQGLRGGFKATSDRTADPVALTVVVLAILTAFLMQISIIRFGDNTSLWKIFYAYLPGAGGARSVSRIVLVSTLGMAIAGAYLFDRLLAMRARGDDKAGFVLAALFAVVVIEQFGAMPRYSAQLTEDFTNQVAAAVPKNCKAFFIRPARQDLFPEDIRDEKDFDAKAYLETNQDVAAHWKDPAWLHYDLHGRQESRYIDVRKKNDAGELSAYNNYTYPLVAALLGIPSVNGLSGWEPPQWGLFPNYQRDLDAKLDAWLNLNGVPRSDICVITKDLPASLHFIPKSLF